MFSVPFSTRTSAHFSEHSRALLPVQSLGTIPVQNQSGLGSPLASPIQKLVGALESNKMPLRLSKAANVHDVICDDSHLLHWKLMHHGLNRRFAVAFKGNKATVEQAINR